MRLFWAWFKNLFSDKSITVDDISIDSSIAKVQSNHDGFPSAAHKELFQKHSILILSEEDAVSFKSYDEGSTVLIRILNPFDSFRAVNSRYLDVIECQFWDLESAGTFEQMVSCGAFMWILREAKGLNQFISRNLRKKIVVHCHAGRARSAAVAAHILSLRGDKDGVEFIYKNSTFWKPNEWVRLALDKDLEIKS